MEIMECGGANGNLKRLLLAILFVVTRSEEHDDGGGARLRAGAGSHSLTHPPFFSNQAKRPSLPPFKPVPLFYSRSIITPAEASCVGEEGM